MLGRVRGLRLPLSKARADARFLSSAVDAPYDRRYRWWEKASPDEKTKKKHSYTSSLKWWEQTEHPEVATERQRREKIRREVSPISESTVRRPPLREITSADAEVEEIKSMTEIIKPHLQRCKSEAERRYLQSFLDKPCLIGKNFFDVDKWTKVWLRLADDYKRQKSVWQKDYNRRKEEKRAQRIREWEGVLSKIENVFSPERAAQLFGPDWRDISLPLNGVVVKIDGDKYHVAWSVPGHKTEVVIHEGDAVLSSVFPPRYVPDFDSFVYTPSLELSPEDWLEHAICEHPLLIVTDTKDNAEFKNIKKMLSDTPYAVINLSVSSVEEEKRSRIRNHLVGLTNWPWFPQIFVSAMFMGGYETLKQINESGSLDTVLVLAGVRQKGLVEREVDRYEQLISEQIGEWRYKQMDMLTKDQEMSADPHESGDLDPDAVHLKWPDPKQREEILQRLIKNEGVDELFFEDMRRKFLRESALEI